MVAWQSPKLLVRVRVPTDLLSGCGVSVAHEAWDFVVEGSTPSIQTVALSFNGRTIGFEPKNLCPIQSGAALLRSSSTGGASGPEPQGYRFDPYPRSYAPVV